ncbi:MAG: PocR ligand-binding domain-containing protein [Victivallales bacterium]|nr:PocR ligand-binding domain-containing protein [Victivallales bacterium]
MSESLEVILDNDLQKLLDSFATAMQIRIVLYGRDGQILRQGREEGNCQFCQLVQQCVGVEKCVGLDRRWQATARLSGACQLYRCHAGLHEAIMPVFAGGDILGYVVFGQVRSTDFLSDETLAQFPPAARRELQERFRNCPRLTEEQLDGLAELLKVLVDYIVRNELVKRGGPHLYNAILQYVEEHFASPITLTDMARHLGRSVSSLSHFLQGHGTTFKRLLIEKRLAFADELIRQQPSRPIKEIAHRAGFSDAAYFSRLYRKNRGAPPRKASGV